MLKAIAFDPGRTTGVALGCRSPERFFIAYEQVVWDHSDLWDALYDLDPGEVNIICESFEFRQGKQTGVDLYPCELIGVIKLHCSRDGQPSLYMQPASVQGKKGFWGDQKLRNMGIYLKGVEHGRSAVKHLLQWYMFGAGAKFGWKNPELVEVGWLLDNLRRG